MEQCYVIHVTRKENQMSLNDGWFFAIVWCLVMIVVLSVIERSSKIDKD
jgi:hypothetical protein